MSGKGSANSVAPLTDSKISNNNLAVPDKLATIMPNTVDLKNEKNNGGTNGWMN